MSKIRDLQIKRLNQAIKLCKLAKQSGYLVDSNSPVLARPLVYAAIKLLEQAVEVQERDTKYRNPDGTLKAEYYIGGSK